MTSETIREQHVTAQRLSARASELMGEVAVLTGLGEDYEDAVTECCACNTDYAAIAHLMVSFGYIDRDALAALLADAVDSYFADNA